MKLWMSSEQMSDCGKDTMRIRKEIVPSINKLIGDCTLGNYKEWAVITIILSENGPNYKEIVRRSLKNEALEFRLKIDYHDFMTADYEKKKEMVLHLLIRSLDLMTKWKDISAEERERIKSIIILEYSEYFV